MMTEDIYNLEREQHEQGKESMVGDSRDSYWILVICPDGGGLQARAPKRMRIYPDLRKHTLVPIHYGIGYKRIAWIFTKADTDVPDDVSGDFRW
jgi:hypothetical protein